MTQRSLTLPILRPLPAFTPFLVVSIVYLVALAVSAGELSASLKGFLMPSLALGFVLVLLGRRGTDRALPRPLAIALTLGGVLLSWLGDLTLGTFVVGLSFFLAAHLCYIALFWTCFRRRPSWWGLVAIPYVAGLLWALGPALGSLL